MKDEPTKTPAPPSDARRTMIGRAAVVLADVLPTSALTKTNDASSTELATEIRQTVPDMDDVASSSVNEATAPTMMVFAPQVSQPAQLVAEPVGPPTATHASAYDDAKTAVNIPPQGIAEPKSSSRKGVWLLLLLSLAGAGVGFWKIRARRRATGAAAVAIVPPKTVAPTEAAKAPATEAPPPAVKPPKAEPASVVAKEEPKPVAKAAKPVADAEAKPAAREAKPVVQPKPAAAKKPAVQRKKKQKHAEPVLLPASRGIRDF